MGNQPLSLARCSSRLSSALYLLLITIVLIALSACSSGGDGGGGGAQNRTTPTYTVDSLAGSGGSISPAQTVDEGDSASFTITPDAGYVIASVTGCGGSLSGNTYTTGAITAACTVNASFSIISYSVSTSAGANGAISPGDATVDHGNTTSFTITPDTNYVIDSVSGCNGSLADNTYTTGAITVNCTVTASFSIISYTVSTSAGANGAISPVYATVDHGSATSFTVTPDTGFLIESISGCGGSLIGDTYTTGTITADCTVSATFIARTLAAVAPLFDYAVNWNDYVQGSDWATTASDSSACDITSLLSPDCLHGGENRVVEATGKTSCTGLTATDALGAFNWTCDDSTGTARLISTGLADGKYLSDLLDFTTPGFNTNAVTVYEGNIVWGTTPSSVWWSNPVEINNTGGNLVTESTIYLVTSDPGANYTLAADKTALVAQPGVTLTGTGFYAVFVSTNSSTCNFLWFEGNTTGFGVNSSYTAFSQLRGVTVTNAQDVGINLSNSSKQISLTDVTVVGSGDSGIFSSFVNSITLTNVVANNNTGDGISLNGPSVNTLTNVVANGNNGNGIALNTVYGTAINSVVANNNVGNGINLTSSVNNTITNVIANNNAVGIYLLSNSSTNTISNITVNYNVARGIYLSAGTSNILASVTANNNGDDGIYLDSSSQNNTIVSVTASNNDNVGVSIVGARNSRVLGVTASNNADIGVVVVGVNNVTSAATAFNNAVHGISVIYDGANNNTFSDLAAAFNGSAGVYISDSSNNRFTGLLELGNTTDCTVIGVSNPGLEDATCLNTGSSNATLFRGISLNNSFVGKVPSDSLNTSDTNGTADFSLIDPTTFDWSNFENNYRAWGIEGSAGFPNADQQGKWIAGSGRIYDWSLLTGDTGNGGSPALLGVIPVPTGDDFITHAWDVSAATTAPSSDAECAAIVAGASWNGSNCVSYYLRGAMEIIGDSIGNDNGLCESDETCLYTPNIGSYQGHGNLISAGEFVDGAVTGVTLLKYETNGVTSLGGPPGGGQVIEI